MIAPRADRETARGRCQVQLDIGRIQELLSLKGHRLLDSTPLTTSGFENLGKGERVMNDRIVIPNGIEGAAPSA